MAGECRVGTEVDVANQPKVCRTAAEGVLSPSSRTCTRKLAPGRRFELRTLRLTDRRRSFRNREANSLSAAEFRHMPRLATRVAVHQRGLSVEFVGSPTQAPHALECARTELAQFGTFCLTQVGRFVHKIKGLGQKCELLIRGLACLPKKRSHNLEIKAGTSAEQRPQLLSILLAGQRVRAVEQCRHLGRELGFPGENPRLANPL